MFGIELEIFRLLCSPDDTTKSLTYFIFEKIKQLVLELCHPELVEGSHQSKIFQFKIEKLDKAITNKLTLFNTENS